MPIDLKIPSIGESITEVQISEWLKSEGDTVKKDEVVAVIDSEKTTFELSAPEAGRLARILHQAGDTVKVGAVVAQIEPAGAGEKAEATKSQPPAGNKEAATPAPETKVDGTKGKNDAQSQDPAERKLQTSTRSKEATPSAPKKKVTATDNDSKSEEQGKESAGTKSQPTVMSKEAPPSAPQIKTASTDEAGKSEEQGQEFAGADKAASEEKADEADDKSPTPAPAKDESDHKELAPAAARETKSKAPAAREEKIIPMTMLRRTVARRLAEAKQQMAMLTTFNEADMSAVQALRAEHQAAFEKNHQTKLGFMSFFVKAVVDALKQFPQLNAEIRGNDLVYHNSFDIGVAIASERGLVVPVLRKVEQMSFAEVEKAIGEFSKRAKEGKLSPGELEGGTFTITNGGVFGSLFSTPIINPPQSGILGMHAIMERPVAVRGEVVIRPMMYLALTYDHRIVDGREAVMFLRRIKEVIENPARLLIGV